MRDSFFYVSGLLDLPRAADAQERRALFRQSMAALARATVEDGPAPLDALHPDALVTGVRVAIADGLVDDLSWLEQSAAGAALYELAAALPPGAEQREVGRRVLSRLLAGNADAFVAIATRMALGNAKGFGSPGSRARVLLVAELPLGLGVADGPLALALTSKRDLAREWIAHPSTGSLPSRRLAARLLERAAREAARRAMQGDGHSLRVFRSDTVAQAWVRLINDRESLVWRHVAVARGLLSPWVSEFHDEIEFSMSARLSPTEWRRAAASLCARIAVDPKEAMRLVGTALTSGLLDRDPGGAVAFAWGLPRAAEVEPEAAAALLDMVADRAPQEVAEAITELRYELGVTPFFEKACQRAALAMARVSRIGHPTRDDGAEALALEIGRDLSAVPREDRTVRERLAEAMATFAHAGAREAYRAAREVLDSATDSMAALDAVSVEDEHAESGEGSIARRTSLAVLRDLDTGILERDVLVNLLRLGGAADSAKTHQESLDHVRDQLSDWIIVRESASVQPGSEPPRHPTLGLRRLRALLHLVDSDAGEAQDDTTRAVLLRKRWLRIARVLLERFELGPPAVMHRTIVAALARTFDALVRAGACDVSDVLLVVARQIDDPLQFDTLAEASMDPDLVHVYRRYAEFMRDAAANPEPVKPPPLRVPDFGSMRPASGSPVGSTPIRPTGIPHGSRLPPKPGRSPFSIAPQASARPDSLHSATRTSVMGRRTVEPRDQPSIIPLESSLPPPSQVSESTRWLRALEGLVRDLSPEPSGRIEALRIVLGKLLASLQAMSVAPSLRSLASPGSAEPEVVSALEHALGAIAQLSMGARGRLDPERAPLPPPNLTGARPLTTTVSRVISGAEESLREHSVSACLDDLLIGVPRALAKIVSGFVWSLVELPMDRPSLQSTSMRFAETLPPWLPPRRTIGGFYVLRALSAGAVGSVFVVCRTEDRHDPKAEKFALKVPEYSATAARSVSEAEFLAMFRDEASALIALPSHSNLARFVTFDAGARPKPILVMELVEGITLEALIDSRSLDMVRALRILDDMLAGLEAMHGAGVGHLDLKPSNVVLRNGEAAVLVDFGLSGRRIRPGCATGSYGAPEVWGADVPDAPATPMQVDIYAFGCVAFEVFTGSTLFAAESEMAQIALHVTHDGFPPPVRALAGHPQFGPVAEILFSTLRRNPHDRPTAASIRRQLASVRVPLERQKWPIAG